jgi:hypothetical protein
MPASGALVRLIAILIVVYFRRADGFLYALE